MRSKKEIMKLIEIYGGYWETECENGHRDDEIKSTTYDSDRGGVGGMYHSKHTLDKTPECGAKIIKEVWHKLPPWAECQHCHGTGIKPNCEV